MYSRRNFLASTAAVTALPALQACGGPNKSDFERVSQNLRAAISANPDTLEFVRFATLAANGHNTQPWRFKVGSSRTSILPDLTRRTEIVDPDDHHLYISLGCAAENFALASAAHGRPADIAYEASGDGRIDIDLAKGPVAVTDMYRAIPDRQTTRADFNGQKVAVEDLQAMEEAAKQDGVQLQLFTSQTDIERVLEFVVAGNSLQMDNPDFVQELKDWIRFNPKTAIREGDGLYSACSGNPTSPTWIGNAMFSRFFKKDAENNKYRSQLRTSAGVAVFTGAGEDPQNWVNVGRSFQRFALKATALGMRHSHINQPIEEVTVRQEFAKWLGAPNRRPDLVIRFGYGPDLPMSLRRPVKAVLA